MKCAEIFWIMYSGHKRNLTGSPSIQQQEDICKRYGNGSEASIMKNGASPPNSDAPFKLFLCCFFHLLLISMLIFFYNFVRLHSTLNNLTPAQCAGLNLSKKRKWELVFITQSFFLLSGSIFSCLLYSANLAPFFGI